MRTVLGTLLALWLTQGPAAGSWHLAGLADLWQTLAAPSWSVAPSWSASTMDGSTDSGTAPDPNGNPTTDGPDGSGNPTGDGGPGLDPNG